MLIKRLYLFIVISFFHLTLYASELPVRSKASFRRFAISGSEKKDIGGIADNIFGLGQDLSKVVKMAAIMGGIAMILFGMLQYGKYRKNPVETPISKVFMTIFIGLCLIALSFVPMSF